MPKRSIKVQKQIMTTVDRFEGDFAVLKHKDHEILLPKEDLPENTEIGTVIALTAMTQEQAEKDKSELAKLVLNDIINETLGAPGTTPSNMQELEQKEEQDLEQINKKIDDINKKIGQ